MYYVNTVSSKPVSGRPAMSIQPYTEDQNDALQEVVNIAMGQAGDSLARILGNFVELSVPRIRLVTVNDVIKTVTGMVDIGGLGETAGLRSTAMEHTIRHPFSEKEVRRLKTGDIVYLNGEVSFSNVLFQFGWFDLFQFAFQRVFIRS